MECTHLEQRHALIHPDQAKAKKAIPVPLNADAKREGQVSPYKVYKEILDPFFDPFFL